METECEEKRKVWHDPDAYNNYGESWWANALDEEEDKSPDQEGGQNPTRQKPTVETRQIRSQAEL